VPRPKADRRFALASGLAALLASVLVARAAPARPGEAAQAPAAATSRDSVWETAKAQVHRGVLNTIEQRQAELRRGLSACYVTHGPLSGDAIALTLDDGPHPEFTPQLLDILREQQVPATFFVVGQMAEKRPDLIRDIAADGHCLGNHTYHHVRLPGLATGTVATEIKACGLVLEGITGQAPHWFRPPGGGTNTRVGIVARALGYRVALWDVLAADSARPGECQIGGRILGETHPGAIILLHDGVQQTVEVLPWVIVALKQIGFRFVTLDELMAPQTLDWDALMRELGIPLDTTPTDKGQPPARF
jgi:peptidoglycan/xylan/chitin deacetylase (PgdA/CDA1 family)